MRSNITFFNRINVRILSILLILLAVIVTLAIIINRTNMRRVYEDTYTERVLLTNSLMASFIEREDVAYYRDLLLRQDDDFRRRQIEFHNDREQLFKLYESGGNEEEYPEILERLQDFHSHTAKLKDERYWQIIDELKRLKKAGRAEYVYIITDTDLYTEDGVKLYTYIFDAEDNEIYDNLIVDGLGTCSTGELQLNIVYETKSQMDYVEYYYGDFGELYYAYAPILDVNGEVIAVLGTDLDLGSMNEAIDSSSLLFNIVFLSFFAFVLLFIFIYLSRSVIKPLSTLTGIAHNMTEGRSNIRFPKGILSDRTEIGVLAETLKEAIEATEGQRHAVETAYKNLRATLDMMPLGILIMGVDDYNLIYVNEAILKIFEYSLPGEELIGESAADFLPGFKYSGNNGDMLIDFAINTETPMEVRCVKFDGIPFTARVNTTMIVYNGKPAILAVIEDVTEEAEYKRMLRDAAVREQEANQLKNRFIATMSHEIRTPMNAILGMSELALREGEVDVKNEHIYTVKEAAGNLLAIINDILDFSKIEAGKLELNPSYYSVTSLINDVVSIIRMRVVDTHICFAVKAESRIPHTLYGDETRIRQVMLNILNNAVKYTEKGYVILDLYMEESTTDETSINLMFSVKDSGVGIKPEHIDKLFNDFTQFEQSGNRHIEGIGLGLAITENIVKLMGGSISVSSKYGEGSLFTVSMPQKIKTPDAQNNVLAVVKNPSNVNVLICVDNDIYANSLTYTVNNLGCKCTLIKNADKFASAEDFSIYNYLFITYNLYNSNREIIQNIAKNMRTVIISAFGETVPEKNIDVLTMPVYCTHIADILNGVTDKFMIITDSIGEVGFTAPDARILIVDDIYTNLRVVQGLLAPYNMKLDLCKSGAESVEMVKKLAETGQRYDLVFMDHKMPGVDGIEATKRIRALGDYTDDEQSEETTMSVDREYFKWLPIVALTANAVTGMVETFMENGFNDFLSKPINTAKMGEILNRWIPRDKRINSG